MFMCRDERQSDRDISVFRMRYTGRSALYRPNREAGAQQLYGCRNEMIRDRIRLELVGLHIFTLATKTQGQDIYHIRNILNIALYLNRHKSTEPIWLFPVLFGLCVYIYF